MLSVVLQAASAAETSTGMTPGWIVAIIAVSALPAFLIVHAFFTLVMGKEYTFPIRLNVPRHGPTHCPRCGHNLANHQPQQL